MELWLVFTGRVVYSPLARSVNSRGVKKRFDQARVGLCLGHNSPRTEAHIGSVRSYSPRACPEILPGYSDRLLRRSLPKGLETVILLFIAKRPQCLPSVLVWEEVYAAPGGPGVDGPDPFGTPPRPAASPLGVGCNGSSPARSTHGQKPRPRSHRRPAPNRPAAGWDRTMFA